MNAINGVQALEIIEAAKELLGISDNISSFGELALICTAIIEDIAPDLTDADMTLIDNKLAREICIARASQS